MAAQQLCPAFRWLPMAGAALPADDDGFLADTVISYYVILCHIISYYIIVLSYGGLLADTSQTHGNGATQATKNENRKPGNSELRARKSENARNPQP